MLGGPRSGGRIRVGSIVLRVNHLQRKTEFSEAALDHVGREGDSDDFMLLRPRDRIGPNLSLDRVRSTLQIPPGIQLESLVGRLTLTTELSPEPSKGLAFA